MKIKLIVEDSWGVPFFPIVIERLKVANLAAIPVIDINACSKKATGVYFRKDYI